MRRDKFKVNLEDESSLSHIFSSLPSISSYKAQWNKNTLAYYTKDYHRMNAEVYHSQHTLAVHFKDIQGVHRKLGNDIFQNNISKGDIDIIPANTIHQSSWDNISEFIFMSLDSVKASQVAYQLYGTEHLKISPRLSSQDYIIRYLGEELKSELLLNNWCNKFYIDSIFNTICAYLFKTYSNQKLTIKRSYSGLSQHQLNYAIDYFNANLSEKIRLTDIAEVLSINQYHFNRLFQQSMGIPPYRYVNNQRIEKAKRLLRQTKLSIADIAMECGFCNHSSLTKHFRNNVGTTPKQYRKEWI